eukprot:EC715284.1.p1 GENE.EC715284.1~~EC715284.1.p1  ORF type:complete len:183 (+),score=13.02 EC715284.1:100-648(+)
MEDRLRSALTYLVRSVMDPSWNKPRRTCIAIVTGSFILMSLVVLRISWTRACDMNLWAVLIGLNLPLIVWIVWALDKLLQMGWLQESVDERGQPRNALRASLVHSLPNMTLVLAAVVSLVAVACLIATKNCDSVLYQFTLVLASLETLALMFAAVARVTSCYVINFIWGPRKPQPAATTINI